MKNIFAEKSDVLIRVLLLIGSYINQNYILTDSKVIWTEIDKILGFRAKEVEYPVTNLTYEQVQKELSSINEKGSNRKKQGVYYTPHDLVKFITINLFKLSCGTLKANNLNDVEFHNIPYSQICYKKTVFDPTCGAGEFLLMSLNIKLDLMEFNHENMTKSKIAKVMTTIYGNDINIESIIITKIRLLLTILERVGVTKIEGLSDILNKNFENIDYIEATNIENQLFDIIIGNPPYVEDSRSLSKPAIKYGNIYANVLDNSAKQLKSNGVLGYVIPLSYVSTPRMKKIRAVLDKELKEQFILSYADRPDCLFTSVHQKLNVFFAKKSKTTACYTSNYQYWYKEEREKLFSATYTISNNHVKEDFIPKIGNEKDNNIFEKVHSNKNCSILGGCDVNGKSVYLNMRATFWIKAFLTEHKSAEYKEFKFDKELRYLAMCVFNSSLFWWYWVCISDCWHITNKELTSFKLPRTFDYEKVKDLAIRMEQQLESTKVYVGTKQTEYEYKHKDCIHIIHEIDDYISELYSLTAEENLYIKNFNLRYRLGGGSLK